MVPNDLFHVNIDKYTMKHPIITFGLINHYIENFDFTTSYRHESSKIPKMVNPNETFSNHDILLKELNSDFL